MAFVAGSSFVGSKVATRSHTCSRPQAMNVQMMAKKGGVPSDTKAKKMKPKSAGFTNDAETLNGRAAMMGFVIAVATEVLNNDHPTIVQQVSSLFGQ